MAIDSYARNLAAAALANGSEFVETDPTVPQYVKDITKDEIDSWNSVGKFYYVEAANTDTSKAKILEFINDYLKNYKSKNTPPFIKNFPMIQFYNDTGAYNGFPSSFSIMFNTSTSSVQFAFNNIILFGNSSTGISVSGQNTHIKFGTYTAHITNEEYEQGHADSIMRVTSTISNEWYLPKGDNKFLRINNTNAWTPTGDYNPATKLYADSTRSSFIIHLGTLSSAEQDEQTVNDFKLFLNDLVKKYEIPESGGEIKKYSPVFLQRKTGEMGFPTGLAISNDGEEYYRITFLNTLFWNGQKVNQDTCGIYASLSNSSLNVVILKSEFQAKQINTIPEINYFNNYETAKIPQSPYLSTENVVEFVPTEPFHPATKKYVDDAVSGAGGGSAYVIKRSNTDEFKTQMIEFINDYIKNYKSIDNLEGNYFPKLILVDGLMPHSVGKIVFSTIDSSVYASFKASYFEAGSTTTKDYFGSCYTMFVTNTSVQLSKEEFEAGNVTQIIGTPYMPSAEQIYIPTKNNPSLNIHNNKEYIPVDPYNPATKKYVDDLVGDINTVLASLTTPPEELQAQADLKNLTTLPEDGE